MIKTLSRARSVNALGDSALAARGGGEKSGNHRDEGEAILEAAGGRGLVAGIGRREDEARVADIGFDRRGRRVGARSQQAIGAEAETGEQREASEEKAHLSDRFAAQGHFSRASTRDAPDIARFAGLTLRLFRTPVDEDFVGVVAAAAGAVFRSRHNEAIGAVVALPALRVPEFTASLCAAMAMVLSFSSRSRPTAVPTTPGAGGSGATATGALTTGCGFRGVAGGEEKRRRDKAGGDQSDARHIRSLND